MVISEETLNSAFDSCIRQDIWFEGEREKTTGDILVVRIDRTKPQSDPDYKTTLCRVDRWEDAQFEIDKRMVEWAVE